MLSLNPFRDPIPLFDDAYYLEQYIINSSYSITANDLKSGVWNYGSPDDTTQKRGRTKTAIPVYAGMKIIYEVGNYSIYIGILSNINDKSFSQIVYWTSTSGTLNITADGYLILNIRSKTNPDDTIIDPAAWDGSAKIELTSFNPRKLTKKYIAFGDSLTKGAVWYPNAELGVNDPYIANYEYQIPTRIAKALGIEHNFINAGVSGIGYLKIPDRGTQNLVDLIKSYDFTDVELITIQAGPNDSSYPLGTSGSTAGDGTICGAILEIINYMRQNPNQNYDYSKIQLIFIQSTPCVKGNDEQNLYERNVWITKTPGGWSLNDFDQEVSKLCYDNHVGYVSWHGCAYVDDWNQRNKGYGFNTGVVNHVHPVVQSDYGLIGDYIAGKIAAMGQNEHRRYETKKYTYDDDTVKGKYLNLNLTSKAFNLANRTSTDGNFSYLLIPVKKGDSIYLRTFGGTSGAKPFAILSQNYLILYTYPIDDPNYDPNADPNIYKPFNGTIVIEQDGFLAVNINKYKKDIFTCEVTWDITDTARSRNFINALNKQVDKMWPEYDDDNVCRVIQTGPSLMGAIHHWAIIGASFDSGEFNYKVNGETKELEYYEYSCWEHLKKINGIPDLYNYSDGGQNGLDWITLGPNSLRGYAYASDTEVQNPYWNGRSGIGYGGGCWWKMYQDYDINHDVKQAFVINLGSNDINNNYPWRKNANNEIVRDNIDPNYDPNNPNGKYLCGTIDDIGTYDLSTNTDILPSRGTPSTTYHIENFQIYNSYCAYIGAILNRILAIQHNAIIFLCTIRNGFAANAYKFGIWQEYNQALKNIAAMERYEDNVYIVDNGTYGPNYATAPLSSMILGSHPNALGYQFIAGYWNTLLDYTIQKNYTKMTQSMFIGTNKSY